MGRYQKRDKMDGTSHADTWRKGTRAHQSYDSTRGHALSRLAKCVISLLPSPASRIIGSQTSAGLCPDCRGPATSVTRARSTLERTNQAPATRTIPSTRPKDANAPPSSLRAGAGARCHRSLRPRPCSNTLACTTRFSPHLQTKPKEATRPPNFFAFCMNNLAVARQ